MSTPKKPKTPKNKKPELASQAARHYLHEAGGAAGGAVAGAAVGLIAGPAGAAAGAVVGGVVGALVANVAEEEAARVSFHDGELDAIIGVNGGDLGAPNLEHPPAVRGVYSAASAGASGSSGSSSDGPMQTPED